MTIKQLLGRPLLVSTSLYKDRCIFQKIYISHF
nr:MAG TPA: hypothetical protein [Caudoviricetes sp.]